MSGRLMHAGKAEGIGQAQIRTMLNSAPTRTASATTEESGDFTVHLDVSNVAPWHL
jgi:hypothetical protein